MLFNSLEFLFLFLPITYVVFWSLRKAQARYVWLAVTGYVFYGYWDYRFCFLMLFSTLVSYLAGLGFRKWQSERARKILLIVPIVVDLLLLGFFKYANFGISIAQDALTLAGSSVQLPIYNIILPVGISFYTFHTITYIVDCYQRKIEPTANFFEFAAYVSLFSQLVAGPIVRFRQIEEDLENLGAADRTRWFALGISYFTYGLVEKVILADCLAAFVDPALAQYERLSTFGTWLAMAGYTFQLYFDFAGYSDMAIGLGFLFGIRIPLNFNSPYKALDPSDFWRRWHISLSTCLRDYLYIPLGGSRFGRWLTYRNLMITMLLGGLWHGAHWTFVIWGAYHGLLLIAHQLARPGWDSLPRFFRQAAMFFLVLVGWVFFRATDVNMALSILGRMFQFHDGLQILELELSCCVLAFAAIWAMAGPNAQGCFAGYRYKKYHAFILAGVLGACVAVIIGNPSSPFLYFQF